VASGWGSVGRRIKEEPDVTDTDATLARLQAICLSLPDTKMSRSWGKPHFTVGGKVFAAFDEIEGEPTLSIKLAGDDADQRVLADPRLRPSRYRGGAEMLVNRIDDWDEVRALVVDSYRLVASRTSVGQAGRRGIVATRPGNDRWRGQAEALGVGASGPQQKDPLRTMRKPQVVIAGAGPAGMMLAYQLVTNGVPVRVLERHPDFEREFRGELIGPSALPLLDRLGILPLLAERGLARVDVQRRMFLGRTRRVMLPAGNEPGALVSQPGLLALLHELCSRHQGYRLDLSTTALRAVREGDRVVALEVRRGGSQEHVAGDVFVACTGRGSKLRQELGVPLELEKKPGDTLWLRLDLSDAKDALPENVDVHMFAEGVVVVLFATTRSRLQIAYSAPGNLGAVRRDLPVLKRELLPRLNEPLRTIVAAKLDEDYESQVLRVSIDRLSRWHVPGLLLLGDAAHTMGPAAALGLNLAIRDSVVAANHLLDAVASDAPIDAAVFAAIEAERRPEIEAAQAVQQRAYRMVHKPLLVQHLMFTLLGAVMRVKRFAPLPSPPVEPRHTVRPSP